jgi:hypothetical protein
MSTIEFNGEVTGVVDAVAANIFVLSDSNTAAYSSDYGIQRRGGSRLSGGLETIIPRGDTDRRSAELHIANDRAISSAREAIAVGTGVRHVA